MTRTRLTGLAATLTLLALVVGTPLLLWRTAGPPPPIPTELGGLWQLLTRPDDGTLLLGLLRGAAWIAWGALSVLVVLEVVALLRRTPAPQLPVLAPAQGLARGLVAAAVLLFVAAPLTVPAPPAHAADPTVGQPLATVSAAPLTSYRPASTTLPQAPATIPATYTVRDGDTLWGIAQRFLGDGARYPEIHAQNRSVVRNPDVIWEGMVLRLPSQTATTSTTMAEGMTRYAVRPGDTLSGIAQRLLGDADRYPEIFDASRGLTQPGGGRLTDPDQIDIGWTLAIPSRAGPVQPSSAPDVEPGAIEETTHPTPARVPSASTATPTASVSVPQGTKPTAEVSSAASQQPEPSVAQSRPPAEVTATSPTVDSVPGPVVEGDEIWVGEPGWLLTGLSMGGGVLAAGLLLAIDRQRRARARVRRPGRTYPTPEARLQPVHRTITRIGVPAVATVRFADDVLRRTAAHLRTRHQPLPDITLVELAPGAVRLHLAAPLEPPAPWQTVNDDPATWQLGTDADLTELGPSPAGLPAPWPLLATIGTDDTTTWLANLEQAGVASLTGDAVYVHDYLRYLTTELTVSPWTTDTTVTGPLDLSTESATDDLLAALEDAARMVERSRTTGTAGPDARIDPPDSETWGATALLIETGDQPTPQLERLTDIAGPHSATAVVLVGGDPARASLRLQFDSGGHVSYAGREHMAVGLTSDEATGIAALLAQGDDTSDAPVPPAGHEGWRALADQTGAVRADLTEPRQAPRPHLVDNDGDQPSLLPAADSSYRDQTATTTEDLAALAPKVPAAVRQRVHAADQTLDRDLEWWHSDKCPWPRLTLLGPVNVRAHGTPIAKRKPFYTELIAHLALREHGATPAELADAFGLSPASTRNGIKTARSWLGTDPTTGEPHLPDATKSPQGILRGTPTYQVINVLSDADLFRRLRLRGQARGDAGIPDLVAALDLVTGRPFDQLRPGGWDWLSLTGIDNHLTCAIVDTAHIITTHYLHEGDTAKARAAAETAILAAPDETIPRLDLAAVVSREGHQPAAVRMVRNEICNLADEEGLPYDMDERTLQVLDQLRLAGGAADLT